nr:hypothetical protein [Tanacetum cinerariifolium]
MFRCKHVGLLRKSTTKTLGPLYLTVWFIAILGYLASFRGLPIEGADEELSGGGSPRVIVYGYDVLPMMPVASPSPDYIPGPEEPQSPTAPQDEDEHELMFIQPHDPDFVPEPIYPECNTPKNACRSGILSGGVTS